MSVHVYTLGLQEGEGSLRCRQEPDEGAGPEVASVRVAREVFSEQIVDQTEQDRTRMIRVRIIQSYLCWLH